jgi:hypothetical protein
MTEADRSLRFYDGQINAVLDDPRLSRQSRTFLRTLWYGDEFDLALTLASRHVQEARTRATILALLEVADSDPCANFGPTRFRMLTNCPDLGTIPIQGGKLDPVAVWRQYYQSARRMELHGVNCLDVSPMHDLGVWKPEWLALHTHAAVRSFNPKFKPMTQALACCPQKAPRNRFGAKVVHISSRAKKYQGLFRIAHLGYYVTKISCGTKYPIVGEEGPRTFTSHQYWHWPEALRMLEVYSHLGPMTTMGGVNDGKELRARVKELFQMCLRVERLPHGMLIDHRSLCRSWGKLYGELGLSNYQPLGVA